MILGLPNWVNHSIILGNLGIIYILNKNNAFTFISLSSIRYITRRLIHLSEN